MPPLDGASVDVPAGALPAGTAIVIATTVDIPTGTGQAGAGTTVYFGPEGLHFDAVDKSKTATVTIPFDPSFASAKDQLTIFTRDAKGAVTAVPKPYVFDLANNTVSFSSSHFSSFRTVAPASSQIPGNFNTLKAIADPRDLCLAFDTTTAGQGPLVMFIAEGSGRIVGAIRASVTAAGFTHETWIGGGTQTTLPAPRAQFQIPADVVSVSQNSSGDVYFATATQIFRVDFSTGQVTLFAGTGSVGDSGDNGVPTQATFTSIRRIYSDLNTGVYVCDQGAHRIRLVDATAVTAYAGNGTSGVGADNGSLSTTAFIGPTAIAPAQPAGIYVADGGRIRRLDPSGPSGPINQTVAGSATGATGAGGDGGAPLSATFRSIAMITTYVDPANPNDDALMTVDDVDQTVREVDLTAATVKLIAGTHGASGFSGDNGSTPGLLAQPNAIFADPGLVFVSDAGNQRIREILLPGQ